MKDKHKHIHILGNTIQRYESVTSTMDVMWDLIETKKSHEGMVVISQEQTHGRGRQERVWLSPKDKGLYFSIHLKFIYDKISPAWCTYFASIALVEAIKQYCRVLCSIKWPNDLYVKDKKVAGILAETKTTHSSDLVLGIGLNVNVFPFDNDLCAISLSQTRGSSVDSLSLFEMLMEKLNQYYYEFKNNNISLLKKKWNQYSMCNGKYIQITTSKKIIITKDVSLADDGALLVRDEHGNKERIYSAEISIMR